MLHNFAIATLLIIGTTACHNPSRPIRNTTPPPNSGETSPSATEVFEHVRDSLRFFDRPVTLHGFIAKYDYLKTRFQSSPDSNIRKMVLDWRLHVPVTDETAEAIRQDSLPLELLEPTLFYLRQNAFFYADLELGFAYDRQLQETFPGSVFLQEQNQVLQKARETKHRLDSVASLSLRPDERLWALGNIWASYIENELYVTEYSGYNYSLAIPYFEQIIEKYPKSSLADNAAFTLVYFSLSGAGEGGDDSYCLSAAYELEKVLKQYPDSDQKAQVMLDIAGFYLNFDDYASTDSTYTDRIIQACRLGIAVAEERLRLFPNLPERTDSAWIIGLLHEKITLFSLQLSISTDKVIYRTGEPVIVTFILVNPTSTDIKIPLPYDKRCPNFNLHTVCNDTGTPNNQQEMLLGASLKECEQTRNYVWLQAGETYREQWDVTQKVFGRASSYANRFPAPARYSIQGQLDLSHPPFRIIHSNNLEIKVED